jgi:hypothetical protein
MDFAPDLSHLTDDERKIIEAVINRQKAEEKRDAVAIQYVSFIVLDVNNGLESCSSFYCLDLVRMIIQHRWQCLLVDIRNSRLEQRRTAT